MSTRNYRFDANVIVQCAIVAEGETDAKTKLESELRRLLERSAKGFYFDIKSVTLVEAKVA